VGRESGGVIMKQKKKKCVLVRDRRGVFYEISVEIAKKNIVPMEHLQAALDYYEHPSDVKGEEHNGGGGWAKMTW